MLEAGLRFRVSEKNHAKDSETFLASFDFGYMINRDSNWSYGGTMYWSADDEGTRLALRPRIRKWVAYDRAFDLSLGIIISASDDYAATKLPGIAWTLSYGRANAFSVGLTLEAFRISGTYASPYNLTLRGDSGWRTGWYVGAMLKHWAAIVGFMAFAMITKDI